MIVVQENRTFNNFFATFPGADGATTGKAAAEAECHIYAPETVTLRRNRLGDDRDFNHYFAAFHTARDGGKMDGFDKIRYHRHDKTSCLTPYQYVDPSYIRPYWDIAKRYVLAEHMFTTQGSGGFTGHQDLIAAGTLVEPGQAMVDFATCKGPKCTWGCDAPPRTHTSLIDKNDHIEHGKGPFPCTSNFTVQYPTIRDLLDAKGISWKYYVPPPCCNINGKLYTAFDVEHSVRYGPEWNENISSPETNIFGDISSGSLPAVSWVIPIPDNSDHPRTKHDFGPEWVASIVNAVGESQYWNSTAIVVVWDDWGGFYDNLDPAQHGYGSLGFRVPAMVASAYAKPRYISKTSYDFSSILKYVEQNWELGYLGVRDRQANSILDCFDYSQSPLQFSPIPSRHRKAFFLHQKSTPLLVEDD